ncbi:MAG: 50S ribosomal protein L18 [Legionellales bacterium RIFCSPHIGHO2_12_FULL_42_9]|nr:MAG: 50S ribosomal protein L18 [Legionellales bacterium RIFCSPHIGHO2_12_FULL_42_9]
MNKHESRIRRGLKTKAIIKKSTLPRLVVYRSNKHIYAQIVAPSNSGDKILVSASTLEKELKKTLPVAKIDQAYQIGNVLAARAKEKAIQSIAFDRSGYPYHGRLKALADGARAGELNF